MKKLSFLLAMLLVFAYAGAASAAGLGFYATAGGGSADWDLSTPSSFGSYNKDTSHGGFGIFLDTNVAKNQLFNYRLSLGAEDFKSRPGEGTAIYDLSGVVLDQDFGFGLVRTKDVRFWLGPELRLAVFEGTVQNSLTGQTLQFCSWGRCEDYKVSLVGIGIGPVIGLNIHMGDTVSFALKGGYLSTTYSGTGSYPNCSTCTDTDFDVTEGHTFINAAIILRGNDRF